MEAGVMTFVAHYWRPVVPEKRKWATIFTPQELWRGGVGGEGEGGGRGGGGVGMVGGRGAEQMMRR